MAGIVIGDSLGSVSAWWSALGLAVVVCLLTRRWPLWQSVAILLCMATLGGLRQSTIRHQHDTVAWPDGYVAYEGVITSEPAEKPKTVAVDLLIADDGRRVKCYIAKDEASRRLGVGDRLKICSRITSGRTFVRQGDWQRQDRSPQASWEGLSVVERLKLRFLCYRHQLLERYRQMGANDEQYAVLAAMTLGDKSAMTKELKDIYAASGASHVLALSGLHLGIIYMLLTIVPMGRRLRRVTLPLTVVAIWAFVLLVGMPLSVVRAAVMISTYALLSLANHGRMSLNALALAAIIILMVSPDSLWDVGFQLSFAAMTAILMVQPLIEGIIAPAYLFDRILLRWAWGVATVSLAAQVGTAPLVAYYFGRLPVYFLLTNFIVIPGATVIIWLVLVALLTIPYTSFFSGALLTAVDWLNAALAFVAGRLPCPSIDGLKPSTLQTTMVYVVIVALYLIVVRYDKHL